MGIWLVVLKLHGFKIYRSQNGGWQNLQDLGVGQNRAQKTAIDRAMEDYLPKETFDSQSQLSNGG